MPRNPTHPLLLAFSGLWAALFSGLWSGPSLELESSTGDTGSILDPDG